jgi:hypothetical protein
MRYVVTTTIWIVSALLIVVASAVVTAGGWFAVVEYLENDPRHFTLAGRDVPTYVVSILLVIVGIVVFVASTLFVNRRLMGRWFQVSLGWLLVSYVFVAAGVVGWLTVVRMVAEGIVGSMGFHH